MIQLKLALIFLLSLLCQPASHATGKAWDGNVLLHEWTAQQRNNEQGEIEVY
ncbi:MAG: hypothetical protein PUI84_04410 [Bacteroidales bacterium]|nr:hypothetical protein [Bacteroidales bacterium]MDY6130068.1 hypothetical protein [Prevotella sp.]